MLERIREIEKERERLKLGGGLSEIERQHKRGKLTARERVERLLDPGTFHELELWAKATRTGFDIDERELPADAVAIGYGEVEGRPVLVYTHDFTVAGGTQAAVQHSKVTKVMDTAVKMGIPYIGIIDSGGVRVQDLQGLSGWRPPMGGFGIGGSGSWMFSPPWASGVVPQISLMLGPNYAGSSYSPIMADFLIMRRGPAYMSLVSPSVIKEVTYEEVTQEEIGGALLHAEVSGTNDLVVESDEEGIEVCRKLLSFLPLNNRQKPPVIKTGDPPERRNEALLELIPTDLSQGYDMHQVISQVVDNGDFFELKPLYAKNVIIGFARLDGQTVGVVANNPMAMGGAIDCDSSDKGARFIRFCDAFNIPLIFLVDTVGYLPSIEQERLGLERHAAKVIYAICEATVPKIVLYIGNCSGWGELAMGNEQLGVDLLLAFPTAQVGQMEPEAVVDIIYRKEIATSENPEEVRRRKIKEFNEQYNNLFYAGARQLIHDIIDPRDTRRILIKALSWLANKGEDRPWKKHGNIPL